MDFTALTPPPPSTPATRLRIKWEHVMIGLIAVTIVAFGAVGWLASQTTPAPAAPTTEAAQPAPAAATDALADAASTAGTLTMDDAVGLVDEARSLMGEARWAEADERLSSVPDELRATSGADELAIELDAQRTSHDALRAELQATIETRQWPQAQALLKQLAAVAPLDAELLDAQAIVTDALNPKQPAIAKATAQTEAPKPAKPAPAAAVSAAASAAPKPAAAPKPGATPSNTTTKAPARTPAAPSTPAPAAPTAPAPAGAPAANGNGALGSIALTPAQEAELNAALAALQ